MCVLEWRACEERAAGSRCDDRPFDEADDDDDDEDADGDDDAPAESPSLSSESAA